MKKILIFIIVCMGLLTGCSNKETKSDPSNLSYGAATSTIEEGVTTQMDILKMFGAPNISTRNRSGEEVWNYNKSKQMTNEKDKKSFFSILLISNRNNSKSTYSSVSSLDLIVTFDKDDIVKEYEVISSTY